MKINRFIAGVFLLLIAGMLSAQQDLDRYLSIAAENNPGIRGKFKEYMAALEVLPQVRALPDPTVAFAYFISPVETRVGPQRLRISASQMFPWFGSLKTSENLAAETAKSKYEVFMEAKSALFNDVRSSYFNIYYNRRAIDLTKKNLDILQTFKNLANLKVETGKVSPVDVYRIEMEIGDLENQLAFLVDQEQVYKVMFNNLLNTESDQEIQTPELLWNNNVAYGKEQILDSIRSNNHQVLVLSMQQQALSFRKELAVKQGKPDFSVGLDYTVVGKGPDNMVGKDAFVFPMIGITIPLYRDKYKAMVTEVVYLQESKEFEKEEKVNVLETVFENTWKEYLDSERRIQLFTSQNELAEQTIKLLETEYSTGNKNFEEILRMERRVLQYALSLEKARADKQASISFINYLMGE